ncbi:MAG TPA: cation diffusion facilitator family transporter [Longimicrobiales bacterium]|nr:cation diffusion facilitator family transporter [Longimicrobiales bacterium]
MGSSERAQRSIRVAQAGLLINAALVVVKIGTGIVGHSYALIADGVESSLDIFSSLIVWRGIHVAARSADETYHFGYGKAESVAAAAVSLMLMGAAVGIAIEAVREILTPHHLPAPFTLIVLVAVIAIKEGLFRFVMREGEALESGIVQADAWHHRSDAITSGAAFLGISIALIGGQRYAAADDVAALLASAIIAFNGIRLLRPALADLMDRAPEAELLDSVAEEAAHENGVLRIEKVVARRAGVGHFVTVHVQADPALSLRDAHDLGGRVRSRIVTNLPLVIDATIHMEPYEGALGEHAMQRGRLSGHRPRPRETGNDRPAY